MRISAWQKSGLRAVYFNFKDGHVKLIPATGGGWQIKGGEPYMVSEVERWLAHNFGENQDFDSLYRRAHEVAEYYRKQREERKCQS